MKEDKLHIIYSFAMLELICEKLGITADEVMARAETIKKNLQEEN